LRVLQPDGGFACDSTGLLICIPSWSSHFNGICSDIAGSGWCSL